ncbi:pseudaminic acid biosynthesis-associated methylase [Desulfobotulus alkaliphilus]|nr:pseudaminic acid biosynthesis-associated methylase [Desulfobotulus alkaliphilus]
MERNRDPLLVSSNIHLFSEIIACTKDVHSIFEVGANIGLNIDALNQLCPEKTTSSLELNTEAFSTLKNKCTGEAYQGSVLDLNPSELPTFDFTFTKGVLIHIHPDKLPLVYEKLYQLSSKYLCIIEYYNPTPVEVEYRGFRNKLFKRDFAGEILTAYQDLKLVNYGFKYHKDNNFPIGDVTWFLLKK